MNQCSLVAEGLIAARSLWCASVVCSVLLAQGEAHTVPVFEDGQAQVVEGFSKSADWIRHFLWVETTFDSDGDGKPDRVHVDVTRPKQTDTEGLKVPVVYETSPYFAGTGSTASQFFWDPKQEVDSQPPVRKLPPLIPRRGQAGLIARSEVNTWVPRGFAVVHSSSPGTGFSQGCPTVGGENESLAPKAVIDWLCGRAKGYTTPDGNEEVKAAWCTGKVGMTGTSYNGTLPIAAATTGVEGLEAIIPISPNTSYYHYYRSNGLVRHPGGYMGEDVDVLYDFINSGDPERRDYCNKKVRDGELVKGFDRVLGDYNPFWASRDYLNAVGRIKAATLMAHGWNDWNVMPEHSVRIYEALKQKGVPCMAYFHQGDHGGPPPLSMRCRWFTRFLYGVDNGIEKGPHCWIVREGDKKGEPTPYPDYPHPDAVPVTLHAAGDGKATGELVLEAKASREVEVLIDDVTVPGAKLAMAEQSEHRLLFATLELQQPLHLSGTARVSIKLAASKKAANLSVWLVSLPWTENAPILDNVITRGWADPQNSTSLTESKPLVPGQFYELKFDLQPDDQVIAKGARIGLMIFSSDRDFTLWPKPGTELSIDLAATSIQLPVVGGHSAYAKAIGATK
ncbi:MAG: Xaa-Pro dipeptidyl-peptidase [Planctomycetota bacterium]